ncbi:iron-sulfur cluster repair di-iron protein [Wukongibacter sp. M2B1]|uniref:iron-sulfur cluster repair di-iron protein n=1 Tax=Wukongibacter sp. M2B1 TaxID=3088895 RepID=UPI003D7A2F10
MKKLFNSQQKIGEIAAIFPKATDIFMEYNIDFCCGGDRLLTDALKEQGINEEEILEKINMTYEEFINKDDNSVDWRTASMTDLIEYIVQKHHTFMKNELPVTINLLNKILKVHYIDHGETLSSLHKLFSSLKAEIEEHLINEEELLFPAILEYEKEPSIDLLEKAKNVMMETEDEHNNAGDILKEMRKITNNYKIPSSSCNSFKRTYEKLEEIESDLFQHIHLENNILFERLKQGKEAECK